MADDRPLDDPAVALGALRQEFDDFKATMLARAATRPTGDFEPYLGSAAKAGTLICNGGAVDRILYGNLWAWAQASGAVAAGLFGTGDGTTTFTLPDLRGRGPVGEGVGPGGTLTHGQQAGSATVTLTTAQLPSHNHSVSTNTSGDHGHSSGTGGDHSHSGGSSGAGGHGGHNSGSFGVAAGGDGAVSSNGNTGGGDHSHSMSINNAGGHTHSAGNAGGHTHTVTQSNVGSGAVVDTRGPVVAINWLVWT